MKLKQRFKPETKALFLYSSHCFNCGKGTNSRDPHHICSSTSSSALNLAPLCIDCHNQEHIGKRLDKSKLLIATIKYLVKNDYEFNEEDVAFYENNRKYYEQ